MRFFLLILLCLAASASAQRKFGKVYSQKDLTRLQDKLLRAQFADSIVDRYVTFVPERTKLFVRFDTLFAGDDPSRYIGGKRLHDIHLKFTDITKYAAPFWIYFSYDVALPELPHAKTPANLSIEFRGDTFYAHHQYDIGTIGAAVPSSRIRGNFRPAVKLRDVRKKAFAKATAIMTKTFGAKAFRKSFSHWSRENHSTEQFRPDGAYFVTPSLDSFFVPYTYSFLFAAHPVDLPATARDFILILDADLNHIDTAAFRQQLEQLPDCIRDGTPLGAMTEQQAIARAIEVGVPPAKEGYQNSIRQAGKHYEWSIFSIERLTRSTDMIGHPCDNYFGTSVIFNAVTGEVIRAPQESSYMKGCYD